ncbi:MAG: hypothetical protein AB8B56_10865 [Crocinitomicaceae bacterium]
MKNQESKNVQPSKLEPENGKITTGKGGSSTMMIGIIVGLLLIVGAIIVYVVTSGGGGGSGGGTTGGGGNGNDCQTPTVNSYSMAGITDRIHLQVKRVKVDVRKDNGTPRDDVYFAAAMYHNSNPNEPQILSSNEAFKIHKDDIGTWKTWGKDLTDFTSAQLVPNSTIALILYDKDPTNQRQDWQYTTGRCMKYQSKENAYGTIYIRHADFNGMQTNDTRTYTLAEGEIEISISR